MTEKTEENVKKKTLNDAKKNSQQKTNTTKKADAKKKPNTGMTKKTTNKTVKKDQKKIEKSEDTKKSKKRDVRVSSIIKEQIKNINEIERIDNIEKEETKENEIRKIEKKRREKPIIDEAKIEEQIEKAKKMPKEHKLKINKKIFINIIWAIVATIYLITINLGELNIEKSLFEKDLKMFSLCILTITIIIFEKAYNKDSGIIAIFGIETLIIGIITLISIYVYILHEEIFINIIGTISATAIVYYIVKCIIIVIKERNKWKNSISDVKKIIADS